MKEGFTFKKVSPMFLRKVIFKNFGGGGGQKRAITSKNWKKSRGGTRSRQECLAGIVQKVDHSVRDCHLIKNEKKLTHFANELPKYSMF